MAGLPTSPNDFPGACFLEGDFLNRVTECIDREYGGRNVSLLWLVDPIGHPLSM
jgi:hypothetical protein